MDEENKFKLQLIETAGFFVKKINSKVITVDVQEAKEKLAPIVKEMEKYVKVQIDLPKIEKDLKHFLLTTKENLEDA